MDTLRRATPAKISHRGSRAARKPGAYGALARAPLPCRSRRVLC